MRLYPRRAECLGTEQASGLLVVDEFDGQIFSVRVVAGVVALVDDRNANSEASLARRTFG